MRVWLFVGGGPDVLELVDVPEPTPGPTALVEVHAAGVNFMTSRASRSVLDRDAVSQVLAWRARDVCVPGEGWTRSAPGERVGWVYAPEAMPST